MAQGPKIAMIGAGSVVFCKTLLSDMMATPALAGAEFALMNPHRAQAAANGRLRQPMVAEDASIAPSPPPSIAARRSATPTSW